MKKITGLVVILAVLILGSFYVTGIVTQRTFNRSLDLMNQTNGVTVSLVNYQRHWFNASAGLNVKFQIPERVETNADGKLETIPAQEFTLAVPVEIMHGPVIYTNKGVLFGLGYATSELNLPKEISEKMAAEFSDKSVQPKFQLSLFVNYLNRSHFQLAVPAFKLISKEGNGEINWLGLTADSSVSSSLNKFNGQLKLDGLKVVKEKMKVDLSAVMSNYSLKRTKDGLFVGDAGFSVPSVVISQDDKPQLSLVQFKAHTESSITKNLFETSFKTSFDKVLLNEKQYGPGLLELSIKNLDAKVLAELNAQANAMQQAPGTQKQQALFAMLPVLPKLFAQGPSFEISTLKLTVPEGDIDGQLVITLPKSENINPFQMMQALEGKGKLQVPSEMVKHALIESLKQKALAETSIQGQMMPQASASQPTPSKDNAQPVTPASKPVATVDVTKQATDDAEKKLTALIDAKLILVEGKNYVVDFQLSQGKITVNGQPFDPSSFVMK